MELIFVIVVNNIWQVQASWLHPCKVCEQGCSADKIKFTRNRKTVEDGGQQFELLRKLIINRLPNGAFCLNLEYSKMRCQFIIIDFIESYFFCELFCQSFIQKSYFVSIDILIVFLSKKKF